MSKQDDESLRRKQALGVGLGISLVGVLALALRYGFKKRDPSLLPETLSPSIFATRMMPTSHGEIVYHVSGSGDPLVFLHGVYPGASSFEWSRVYPEFTAGWEVIAPDLLGFGESARPSVALDLREQAESLVEFLHVVCSGRPPVVVASGLGAKLALLLAAQHPEFPKRLVLWLPLEVRRLLRGKAARMAMGISRLPWLRSLAWRSYLSSPAFFHSWLAKIGYAEEAAADEEAVSVLANCAGLYQSEVAIWGILKGSFQEDLTSRLRDVRCPTTILWPESSVRYLPADAEILQREIGQSSLKFLPVDGLLAPLRHPTFMRDTIGNEIAEGGVVRPDFSL